MSSIKVVIPLYKPELSEFELWLVKNNIKVLEARSIAFLLPEGLEIATLEQQIGISKYEMIRVSDEWLGRKNGIAGYNRMMLSGAFYELFADVDYILICQSDVYIFRDDLDHWCALGYDCIAAPWVKRPIYDAPILKQYMWLRKVLCNKRLHPIKQNYYNRIGNGGLSLRCIKSFAAATERYGAEIDHFLSQRGHLYHEDSFWSYIPEEFKYPSVEEAMHFSIDTNPQYCLSKLRGAMPMGCHGLTRKRLWRVWSKYLAMK